MQANEKQTTAEETAGPRKEHEWLHQMIGEWTCEGEASCPDQPPAKWTATEVVRSVGGLWVVAEAAGEMPGGGTAQSIMTLGYDPAKGRFAGTFVASTMTHLWVYDGELDAGGTVLTLHTAGPGMTPGGAHAKYRDVVELKSNGERTLTSNMLAESGEWIQIMTATYRRK